MSDVLKQCREIIQAAIAWTQMDEDGLPEKGTLGQRYGFFEFAMELRHLDGTFGINGPNAILGALSRGSDALARLRDAVQKAVEAMKALPWEEAKSTSPRLFFRHLWAAMLAAGIQRADRAQAIFESDRLRTEELWQDFRRQYQDYRRRYAPYPNEPNSDCWSVLALPPTCTLTELNARFRQLALQHHPDRGGDDKQMAKINEAYDWAMEQLLSRQAV
jgi:DnaJ domain